MDAEIDKVALDYSRAARIPGFRPGKVPPKVVRQRFRDQILHDVAHGLIPRAVDDALRERGLEPVNTPDIRDVVVEEGQPLKFTASFETVPPIDPGDYSGLTLRKREPTVDEAAVDGALERLRERAARYEPIEGRGIQMGDSVVLDLKRTAAAPPGDASAAAAGETHTDRHENVTVDIGASANPPGFDEELAGLYGGRHEDVCRELPFRLRHPGAGGHDRDLRRRGQGDAPANRARRSTTSSRRISGRSTRSTRCGSRCARTSSTRRRHEADREIRSDLLRQLAARVTFDVPASLVEREIDRRVEEFVRRLVEQQIDPTKTNVNWEEYRERQRDAAVESVRSALVLDEIARRDGLAAYRRGARRRDRAVRRAIGPHGGGGARAARERGRACAPLHRTAAGENDGVPDVAGAILKA